MFKLIKFPAEWFDAREGDYCVDVAVFELGPGPCGKEAIRLDAEIVDNSYFKISQTCHDGSKQVFIYPLATIVGRIQMEEISPINYSGNVVPFGKG